MIDENGGNNESSKAVVNGNIKLETKLPIEGVNVALSSEQPEFPRFSATNIDGQFNFEALTMEQSYNLIPSKNDEFTNGLSTLDLC